MDTERSKTEDVEIKENISFSEMLLSDQVLAGLTKCNFIKPSPIQLRAIPLGRCGLDMLIKSKSGTGKTLVFCTIILEKYKSDINAPQALIVVPTREIALQVENYLNSVGCRCPGFKAVSVIGGRDIIDDRKRVNKCKAIVGTLGRLQHLIQNNVINMNHIQTLVLDEADKLMSGDFRREINQLFTVLSKNRQVIAASATYANDLDKLLLTYMQNPIAVSATREVPILIGIKQFVYEIENLPLPNPDQATSPAIQVMLRKVEAIQSILSNLSFKQCILFSNSQLRAESFSNYLSKNGWTVDLILGSQEQHVRTSTFQKFCQYKSRILIASNLMARGVDVENVNLVINLDVPNDSSTYLHRIGRCGRFGTLGISITLVSDKADMMKFRKLLGHIGGGEVKVAKFPMGSAFVDTSLWDFSDRKAEFELYGEVCGLSEHDSSKMEEDDSLANFSKKIAMGNANQSSKENLTDSVESRNMELLEISELLIGREVGKQVDVDMDLFTNFSDQSKAFDQISVSGHIIHKPIESISSDIINIDGNIAIADLAGNSGDAKLDDIFEEYAQFTQVLEIEKKNSDQELIQSEQISENADIFEDFDQNINILEDFAEFTPAKQTKEMYSNPKFKQCEHILKNAEQEKTRKQSDEHSQFVTALKSLNINGDVKTTNEIDCGEHDSISASDSLSQSDVSESDTSQISEAVLTSVKYHKPSKTISHAKQKPLQSMVNRPSDSSVMWHQMYWQQLNQINQYVAKANYRF